jgi:hypothetical protein
MKIFKILAFLFAVVFIKRLITLYHSLKEKERELDHRFQQKPPSEAAPTRGTIIEADFKKID